MNAFSALHRRFSRAVASCDIRMEGWRSGRAGDAAAALLGAATVLSFAPFGLYLLSILTLASLLWLTDGQSWRRAAWRGFLFGAAEFLCGVYWIEISVHQVGGAPVWVALLMLVFLVAIMALYSAAALAFTVGFVPRPGILRSVAVFPAIWVLLEWLRSWVLGGFPWLSLGYGQIDSPLRGYAPLLGVFGVSLAVALSAGLLHAACLRHTRLPACAVALVALAGLWLLGGGLSHRQWTQAAGEPVPVALVQGDIPQDRKWEEDFLVPTLDRYRDLTEQHWDSRLIIWPEASIPAYQDEVQEDFLDPLEAEARKHGTDMLIGVPTYTGDDHYYNSVISLGSSDGVYNKRHLVPFGEYFPVPDWVRHWLQLMDLPYSDFTTGARHQPLLEVAGYPVDVSICYEDAFGDEIMRGLPQAAFLVNVSNDGWFGDSIALPQHLEIGRMRALETGRYLLRATNTGISAIVDPGGRVVARVPREEVAVLTGRVQPMQGRTPFIRWGNAMIASLCALWTAAMVLLARRRASVGYPGAGAGTP